MARHQHRAIPRLSSEYPYQHPVRNPAVPEAHGNIARLDVCRCGMVRWTNINQNRIEQGVWTNDINRIQPHHSCWPDDI